MRLNNRPFACAVVSASSHPAGISFTGTAMTAPADVGSGTITGDAFEFTVAGGVYEGARPQGETFEFGDIYLLREAADTSPGELYQFMNGQSLRIKNLADLKTMGYQECVDDILLFGPASRPAQMEWRVASVSPEGLVQTLAGRQTTDSDGGVLSMVGKRLIASTGLADITNVLWACTTTENTAFPTLRITIKANAIKITGWFNDGTPGFAPFTLTGKIYRDGDSTHCPFSAVGTGSCVREIHGFIDGSRLAGTAEVSAGSTGWEEVSFTGARPN